MDQRKSLIITGLALFIIIAVVVGTITFLVRGIKSKQNSSQKFSQPTIQASVPVFEGPSNTLDTPILSTPVPSPNASASPTPVPMDSLLPRVTPSPTPRTSPVAGSTGGIDNATKAYNGTGFSVNYLKNWGILTCNNSMNFEFDPTNSTDQLNVGCNYASKPVTVLVGEINCQGNTTKIGNVTVVKSVINTSNGVNYRWCTQTQPKLDITHRVSSSGGRATSSQDYSSQVEDMIKTFKAGAGS